MDLTSMTLDSIAETQETVSESLPSSPSNRYNIFVFGDSTSGDNAHVNHRLTEDQAACRSGGA